MFDNCLSVAGRDRVGEEIQAPMKYRAVSEHLSCDLGGEAVILNLKTGKYYGLNSIGVRIWQLLQSPASFSSIETQILDEFDVEREECRNEISSFLGLLKSESLIECVDGITNEILAPCENGKGTAL